MLAINEWYTMHKDAYKDFRALRQSSLLTNIPPPAQAGTTDDPIILGGMVRSQLEHSTDTSRKPKRTRCVLDLTDADLNIGLVGDMPDTSVNKTNVIKETAEAPRSTSESQKRRNRRKKNHKTCEVAGSNALTVVTQQDPVESILQPVRGDRIRHSPHSTAYDDNLLHETGSVNLSADYIILEPAISTSILEILRKDQDDNE